MNAVQIAGCSGAGKSAIAAVLARRGLVSIDSDDDPYLARFVDPTGAEVAEVPMAPDLAWLARHSWAWDPARLDELILAASSHSSTRAAVCAAAGSSTTRLAPLTLRHVEG